jgi:hypothetical protein
MAPSRSFSIFLLKEAFDANSALEDENPLTPYPAENLPAGTTLYILDSRPHPPWWKNYFGIDVELMQETKGAIVFLPTGERVFALCLGHVAHNLKDESYEYDFGIRTTLNCVDPQKLKNTDTLEPGSSRRRRTQLPVASSLRISTKVEVGELTQLCARLLELYRDDSYLTTFPNIQKIAPVRDPDQLATLNNALVNDVRAHGENLRLAVPDLIDYTHSNDSLYAKFSGTGACPLYSDVSIDRYYEYLAKSGAQRDELTIDKLKTHRLHLINEHGESRDSHSIFKSLIYDTTPTADGATYHLNEGNWYEVDRMYVASLQAKIDPFWADLDYLPECIHKHERATTTRRWATTPTSSVSTRRT